MSEIINVLLDANGNLTGRYHNEDYSRYSWFDSTKLKAMTKSEFDTAVKELGLKTFDNLKVKFQNSKANRNKLKELGHEIYDPHHTFNRKPYIIIGTTGMLYGVYKRDTYLLITVEEYIEKPI